MSKYPMKSANTSMMETPWGRVGAYPVGSFWQRALGAKPSFHLFCVSIKTRSARMEHLPVKPSPSLSLCGVNRFQEGSLCSKSASCPACIVPDGGRDLGASQTLGRESVRGLSGVLPAIMGAQEQNRPRDTLNLRNLTWIQESV